MSSRQLSMFVAGIGVVLLVAAGRALAADESLPTHSPHPWGAVKAIELEDIVPGEGLLLTRAQYTYQMYRDYTPRHVLTLNYSTQPSDRAFPGDTIGRYILSTSLLSRALHEPAPKTLQQVMAALPSMLNAEGYLGWVLPRDRADETGLSNIMWSNGLSEYWMWTHDPAARKMNENVFAKIILPAREAYYYYYAPEKKDGKIRWVHCTGDTAQAFGIIDPATRGYALFPSPELRAEIDELIRLYRKIDPVRIQAQIHAVLFTTRGILRWYEFHGDPENLRFAESLYQRYRSLAMTENYENYNWFGRPKTTEGCAIVDSLTVAFKLWQLTGKTEYLEDAQLILFNGLLANQQGCGGDFGTNVCLGAKGNLLLKHLEPAPWCCSVWGGKGLARAMQYSQFLKEDGLIVTVLGNNTATARLADGALTLKQTTGYPYEGGVQFEVVASQSSRERELLVFLPSWIVPASVTLNVNGQALAASRKGPFLSVRRSMKPGDLIAVRFTQSFRCVPPLYPERSPGYHRYLFGPLVLGVDTGQERSLPKATEFAPGKRASFRERSGELTLMPVCDLMNGKDESRHARSHAAQVLFKD